jgi:hypothetical protein
MTEPPPYSDAGTPRWVKVSAVIAVVVVALVGVMLLAGGPGEHGPGRHSGGDGSDKTTPQHKGGHTGPPPGIEH